MDKIRACILGKSLKTRSGYFTLLGILLVALALRLTTARFDYLLEVDPWYHYKIAEIFLKTGEYPMYEYYSRYPFGEPIASPPGLYYMPVYIYKAISFTGISFFRTFQLLPAIFGSLSVVPLYLLAKELYNRKIGFLAALLFALSPAGIERSLAGFYRGDVFMLFAMLFAFYFFVYSIEKNPRVSPLAALFLFFGSLAWQGWFFALAILTAAFCLAIIENYFKNGNSSRLIISYAVCIFGLLLVYSFNSYFYRYETYTYLGEMLFTLKVVLFSFLILAVLDIANRKYLKEHKRAKVALPLVFLFAIILFGYSTGYFETLGQKISYAVNVGTVKTIGLMEIPFEPWNIGITEQRKVGIEYLAYIYNILIFIFPLGFLFLLRQKFSFKTIFSLIFVLSSLLLLIFQIRFTFIVSPAVCLLAALPLYCLSIQKNWKRYISLILIFLLIFTNACAATKFSSSAQPLVTSDLYEGLTWIRKNTPEDSIILSWWDYTGPILAVADRKTVTHTAPSGIVESTALAFRTSNETQALEIIKSMNEDFVLRDMKVDYILLDFRIYSLWSKILILEPYVNRPLKVENKDLFQSMLHNMYTKQKLENFKLVFSNRDVRIYEPIYNYTRIIEIETKRYYSKNEEVKIKIKTKSNELENVILKINVTDPQKNLIFTKEEPIEGTSQRDMFFTLLGNTTKGTCTILAELYSPQMKKMHSMKRNFIVIN